MKKLLSLLLLVCMSTTIFAQDNEQQTDKQITAPEKIENSFSYVGLGLGPFPAPIPTFSFGFRKQVGHRGFDLGLQAETLVEITSLKVNGLYLHYFKPNLCSQFYVGAGAGAGVVFTPHHYYSTKLFASPELVFGKQYQNESDSTRFFQAEINFPIVSNRGVFWMPLVILNYGIGF